MRTIRSEVCVESIVGKRLEVQKLGQIKNILSLLSSVANDLNTDLTASSFWASLEQRATTNLLFLHAVSRWN